MKAVFWGTRGSIAAPGPETTRYGGNTSCVEVRGESTVLILDAGTGIRALGAALAAAAEPRRVDILLTHLHMDHLQGLGFFAPLYMPEFEVHIWGPASTTLPLDVRLSRYLSPPLFPVRMADLPRRPELHEVCCDEFQIGEFAVKTTLVCHPGSTVAYRISGAGKALAYMPDHEPALGLARFPLNRQWTSGITVASGVDLLIHDAQYSDEEYPKYVGWGHSSVGHAVAFAQLAEAQNLVLFHHDPSHSDAVLDDLLARARGSGARPNMVLAREGDSIAV